MVKEDEKSEIILDIFMKYSAKENGFFPFQYPTGNGKTYYLIRFLSEMIMTDFSKLEKFKKKKIIVVTNNKNNIQEIYDEVVKNLKKAGMEDKKKEIFWLKAVGEILSDVTFLREIYTELYKKSEFYERLKRKNKKFIENFRNKLTEVSNKLEKNIELDVYRELEEFILVIKVNMLEHFKAKEYYQLPTFLEKLYPMISEINMSKKIYIMTTDKFLYGHTGRTKTEYFYADFKENLIFIDEIDSAKERFLRFTREQRTLTVKNIINVFNERFNSFSKKENNLLRHLIDVVEKKASEKIKKDKGIQNVDEILRNLRYEKNKLLEKIEKFEKKGKKLRKKYFLTKKYFEKENSMRVDLFEENGNFLFEGKELYLETKGDNCLITEKRTNIVLSTMILEIFEYVYCYFYQIIEDINQYHTSNIEEKEVEREIISHLFYNSETQKSILNEYKNFYIPIIKIMNGKNFKFNNSCCYIEIYEENPEYEANKKVIIGYQYMYLTPEEILYNICTKNLVFGISATAEFETCIGNFDIKWLRLKLRENYFRLDEKEKKLLLDRLDKINNFEKKIKRNLNVFRNSGIYENISSDSYRNIYKLKKNKEMLKKILNLYDIYKEKIFEQLKQDYQLNYFTFELITFLNFLLEKDTSSLLFIGNRFSHSKILKEMLEMLGEILEKKINFEVISAGNFTEKLRIEESKLIKKLENHQEKTIIFTTYQSAGTGVNIKHKYSENIDKRLIKLEKRVQKIFKLPLTYKDIDEIALENKTNLIQFDDELNDKITLLYKCNLLLKNNNITQKQKLLLLNREEDIIVKKIYMSTSDYVENSAKNIVQGLGRTSRTKVRGKIRNIYVGEETEKVLLRFNPKERLFIGDFNYLLEEIGNFQERKENKKILEKVIFRNRIIEEYYFEKFIRGINEYNKKIRVLKKENLKKEAEKKLFKIWKNYEDERRYILKNPTISTTKKSRYYFSIGEKVDSYHIKYKNDKISQIYFPDLEEKNEKKKFEKKISNLNISKESSKGDLIAKIPILKEFCQKNIGNFQKAELILLPYIYQAVYVAMVGEMVIKELFFIYGIKIKATRELIKMGMLEVFDDISEFGMRIDYKNYNLDKISNREFLVEIIEDKINRAKKFFNKENKLFIVNLIDKKTKEYNKSIYFYNLQSIQKKDKNLEEYSYQDSEVIIVTGVLRYNKNDELEVNTRVLEKIKIMLEGKDE